MKKKKKHTLCDKWQGNCDNFIYIYDDGAICVFVDSLKCSKEAASKQKGEKNKLLPDHCSEWI